MKKFLVSLLFIICVAAVLVIGLEVLAYMHYRDNIPNFNRPEPITQPSNRPERQLRQI